MSKMVAPPRTVLQECRGRVWAGMVRRENQDVHAALALCICKHDPHILARRLPAQKVGVGRDVLERDGERRRGFRDPAMYQCPE